jgi:hypothetical protein
MTEEEYIDARNISLLGVIDSACRDLLFLDNHSSGKIKDIVEYVSTKKQELLSKINIEG